MVGVFYSPSSSSKRLEYSTRPCPRWWYLHKLWGGAIGYPRSGGRAPLPDARLPRPRLRRRRCRLGRPARPYTFVMADEDTILEQAMDNLKGAGQRIRATQSFMRS